MILINTKTNEAHSVNQKTAAKIIGVHRTTIWRWKKSKSFERFNFWAVYLHVQPKPVK